VRLGRVENGWPHFQAHDGEGHLFPTPPLPLPQVYDLRERRLDIEEALAEAKRLADQMKASRGWMRALPVPMRRRP
jgi:hypothetical protein